MSQGLGEWKKLYQRAVAMSMTELADRMRQQATARLDLLRYRAGISFEPRLGNVSRPSQARFFFSADEIPYLCAQLHQIFPAEADEIVERAERICRHQFDLLGYRGLDYGPEIDWHCDRVHGIRAPRKPWFQIRYLDFAEVGDSKVTWELNRHQHLVTLAKAFRLTGKEKFARELFSQWEHWNRENPYPIGINWVSSLEVSFRSLSWLWVFFLISGSPAMPVGFRSELCRKLAVAARHIESHLSTYFSPNTHLLGEATALFFIGTLFPELRQSGRWQRRGWRILQLEAERQVREDGLHFEQSVYYHVYALDFFLHASVLASRNGIAISHQCNRILERMLEALCVLGRSGPPPRLGDDDGGRLFDGQRNRWEHLPDPLATGAVMFRRGDFKSVAGGLREETLWLLGEAGAAEFDRLPTVSPQPRSTALRSSGLYLMTGRERGRQLVIDAGPQGADTAGHGHADALSITANSRGCPVLIDPGTFEYVGSDLTERNRFRGTKSHNTLVVDGLDQSEPKGPFSWVRLPKVLAEGWINGETFDLFVGSHDGYTRLADPVVPRRFVFSLKSGFWLVRDQVLGRGKHKLDLFWHLNPEFRPIGQSNATFRSEAETFSIRACDNHSWSQEILSVDWSPAYGQRQRHPVLHFSTTASVPAEFVSLLIPGAGVDSEVKSFAGTISPGAEESVAGYRFETAREEHCIVFGSGKPWSLFSWSSDADFFYWGQSRDKTSSLLICCHASYVAANGRKIIYAQQTFSRCEIISDKGEVRVISSDDAVVLDKEAFGSISAEYQGKPG
jgi:Heparinase II/III-like protein/Heparinase II/III N-terminus